MDIFDSRASIGDDGALCDLPIAVESVIADFVNADRDAIEIKVGELTVSRGAEINAAIRAEGEEVHEDSVIRVIDRECEAGRGNDSIDHALAEAPAEITLVRRIHVAMKDAGYVVAVIDADKFSTERIAVTMFEKNLFAGM